MVIAKQVVILGPLTVMHATRFADLEYFLSCLHTVLETASRPPWARGLKQHLNARDSARLVVAPPVGAWIETACMDTRKAIGAGRAPRGRVD